METDKRKKRKGIIILTVIVILSATCYFGYEYYKQQQTEKKIAHYNDIDNFKEFAVEGTEKIEFIDKGHKIKGEFIKKKFPVGSDYRTLVYELISNGFSVSTLSVKTLSAKKNSFSKVKYFKTILKNGVAYSSSVKIMFLKQKQKIIALETITNSFFVD